MTHNNESNTCRLCGSNSGVFISILDPSYEKYTQNISSLLNIMIYVNDPLPKVLCHRCVIKIDDFQAFVDNANSTQELLKEKFYSSNKLNSSDDWKNYPSLPSNVGNGLDNSASTRLDSSPDLPTINPPAIISFNLLTCSNSSDDSFEKNKVENSLNFATPQNDSESLSIEYRKDLTPTPSPAKLSGPRRGSRPFPKKPGEIPASQNRSSKNDSQSSKSDVERVSSVTDSTSPEGVEHGQESEESSTADEKSSKSKTSTNSSPVAKKKKKYLSPFEVPSRRKRNRRKPAEEKKRKKNVNKIESSSDEDTAQSVKKLTSIPEKDLEKYFILTKIPGVGMIYTCKKCEAIFTTAKATSSHTKCVGKEQASEDEQCGKSSSSESSDVEPSDASKSDAAEKESIYQCSYCDKPFTRNVVCLQHEQTHIRDMNVTDEEDDVYVAPKSKKNIANKFLVEKFLRR